jgi:peroxiredoxin
MRLLSLICIVAFAPTLASCGDTPVDTRTRTPNFELVDLDGQAFQLKNYQGKVVLLNFFSVTCDVCQAEVPDLIALQAGYKDQGLVIAGVAANSTEALASFRQAFGINYPILRDPDAMVSMGYNVSAVPMNVFIDREGWIVATRGYLPLESMEAIIKALL